MEKLQRNFQVDELEARLEMKSWNDDIELPTETIFNPTPAPAPAPAPEIEF